MNIRTLTSLGLLTSGLVAQEAADPLKWVPQRATLVILVNRPGPAVQRWDKLAERMKSKEVSLVRQALVEDFGGLPVLDPEAPLVEFNVPAPVPGAESKDVEPVAKAKDLEFRILSFKKREAFQARFKPADMAKAAASYTTVTVGGKPMLAALRGNVAILAPKDQGALLKSLLAEKTRFAFPPENELAWAKSQDVAFLVSVDRMKGEKKPVPPKPASSPAWAPVEKVSLAIREHPEREIASLVMGLRLNDGGDLLGSFRLGIAPGGELARLTAGLGKGGGPFFRGLADTPFALAFGMDIPKAWADSMAESAAAEARKDPAADLLAQAAMQGILHQIRGFGLALRGPKAGAAMASGIGFAMSVEDSKTFMAHAAALAARPGKEGQPGMRIEQERFQGRPLTRFVGVPQEKKAEEGAAPSMMPPPEAIFGSREVKSSLLAADDHTVLAGFGDPEGVFTSGLASLSSGGLGQLPRLQRTRGLIGEGQAALYLSLPELAQMVSAFLPLPVTAEDLKDPVPPIGLSLNVSATRIDLNVAAPHEALALIGRLAAAAAALRKPQPMKGEDFSDNPKE